MNNFYRVWRVICFTLDGLLLCDVAIDLWKKYKNHKATLNNADATEEEPEPKEEATA